MKDETKDALREDSERTLSTQICPRCKEEFELVSTDKGGRLVTVTLHRNPRGELDHVCIRCPFCSYEESL
jgi:hypothetical protein